MLSRDISRVRIRLLTFNRWRINDQRPIFKMATIKITEKSQKHASSPTTDRLKALLRLITHCHVLARPARFLIRTVTAVAHYLILVFLGGHYIYHNHSLVIWSKPGFVWVVEKTKCINSLTVPDKKFHTMHCNSGSSLFCLYLLLKS